MSQFDRMHMISYYHSIVTVALLQNLYTPPVFNASAVGGISQRCLILGKLQVE